MFIFLCPLGIDEGSELLEKYGMVTASIQCNQRIIAGDHDVIHVVLDELHPFMKSL